ncbi:MAG: zinc ABC transporter substrate-binding protein [Primorskyibacter sp.]
MRHLILTLLTAWGLLSAVAGPTQADVPRVVTDIRPVQALVARIMAGLAVPTTLIRHGYTPHDYRLRASELSQLGKADIVFWVGAELTPVLATQIERQGMGIRSVALLYTHHTRLLRYRSGDMFNDPSHATHVMLPNPTATENVASSLETIDPNAWLDPDNAKLWAAEIAIQLSRADPENADVYMANAWHAKKEIDEAIADVRETLRPFSDTPFVVYHDGYHYFEAYFDIRAASAVYLSHTDMPPREDDVQDLLRHAEIPCAFVDPRFGRQAMRDVIAGTKTALFSVDPLGVYLPSGPNFYTNLLRSMAQDFAACTQAQY